jgi:hypothetical protein
MLKNVFRIQKVSAAQQNTRRKRTAPQGALAQNLKFFAFLAQNLKFFAFFKKAGKTRRKRPRPASGIFRVFFLYALRPTKYAQQNPKRASRKAVPLGKRAFGTVRDLFSAIFQ